MGSKMFCAYALKAAKFSKLVKSSFASAFLEGHHDSSPGSRLDAESVQLLYSIKSLFKTLSLVQTIFTSFLRVLASQKKKNFDLSKKTTLI